MRKVIMLMGIILLFPGFLFAQSKSEIKKHKNKMAYFLFEHGEFGEMTLSDIAKILKRKDQALFIFEEIENECSSNIKLYIYGASANVSKRYALLVRGDEFLFLGESLSKDEANSSFFDFVKFYPEASILCYYGSFYKLILSEVYEYNNKIESYKIKIPYPDLF